MMAAPVEELDRCFLFCQKPAYCGVIIFDGSTGGVLYLSHRKACRCSSEDRAVVS